MSAKTFWNTVAHSLFILGSFTIASPSFAVSVNLRSVRTIGDVGNVTPTQATITNAYPGGVDDPGTNYNVSGNQPLLPYQLETSLGLTAGALGLNAAEGSAISFARNFQAGDVFSFNSNFQTFDTVNVDRAFVSIVNSATNAVITPLTLGNSTFNYTFPTANNYTIGVGVVDVNDFVGSSRLTVSNANVAPVPEPLTILGSVTALGLGANMRRRFGKTKSQ
ncbi:MAG: PEP-CTERM sorting domain-containing protein [Rhizonema sp. PD37]|nr:PEP-CTERM sorting domain-containing protein [Rhizonema sp. PD37]